MSTLVIVVGVVALLGLVFRLSAPRLGTMAATGIKTINDQSVLGDCPAGSANCVSSESSNSSNSTQRLIITRQPDDAMATLSKIISEQPGTRIVSVDDRYIHATFSTPLMGYIDDVEFLLSDDKATIQIRSASRAGKSDLGANGRRVELLRQAALDRL